MNEKILITRKQFEKIKEIFDNYDVNQILWREESLSGIGPTVTVEFNDKPKYTVDITDVENW
jgi:hypothetical protein